jgi:hypothetical protein
MFLGKCEISIKDIKDNRLQRFLSNEHILAVKVRSYSDFNTYRFIGPSNSIEKMKRIFFRETVAV